MLIAFAKDNSAGRSFRPSSDASPCPMSCPTVDNSDNDAGRWLGRKGKKVGQDSHCRSRADAAKSLVESLAAEGWDGWREASIPATRLRGSNNRQGEDIRPSFFHTNRICSPEQEACQLFLLSV